MTCEKCGSSRVVHALGGLYRYHCKDCGYDFD